MEAELADRLDAGGVHRGQDQDQPGRRSRGGLGRLVDLILAERLDDAVGSLADPDALDRAAEDRLLPLAEREQRPQRHQDVGAAGPCSSPRTARTSSRVTSRRWP